MIGIWSGTFLLEDLFNSGKQYDWQRLCDTQWRLSVTDYPVYDSRYLETTVEIGTENTDDQIAHNRERLNHPSALISFHIDLELGDLNVHDDFETDLTPDPVPSFDLDQLNMTVLSSAAPVESSLAVRIIGEAGGNLVTENKSSVNGTGRSFDVYDIAGGEGDTPPAITHRLWSQS